MAAKKEADEGSGSTAAEQVCWRKQVDDNLKRLHSLHFGAETALKKRDFSSAQILGLRLLGFLDSHSHSELDHAFVRPIRCEAISNINSARRSLISDSDRKAFELAKKAPTCVFGSRGDIDTEKIKQSKYIRALIQHSNGITLNELGDQSVKQDKPSSKALNSNNQAKRIALRSNFSRENNNISPKYTTSGSCNYDECRIVEKPMSFHNQTKSQCSLFIQKDEEERTSGNSLGAKRMHVDIRSPSLKSPLSSEENNEVSANGFVTARAKLEMDARQKRGLSGSPNATVSPQSDNNGPRGYGGRSYGFSRRGIRGNFVPPIKSNGGNSGNLTSRIGGKGDDTADDSTKRCLELLCGPDGELPEKLRNLEPRLIEHVSNEIMDKDPNVRWEDIAGLDHAKKCVTEMVIWPLLRPDIFKGCRSPGKGLLLFGPPGTGKTMIGKAIAGEAKATFFYISASSLTSKWIGEGEKLVRALFGVASCRQPAVIFVDEIDSLLSQRKSEGEHESSRRLKTQFLIEMEGFDSGSEQILLIGATNRPQELDEAARRRLTKRLYIPLPSSEARAWIIQNLLKKDGLFKLEKEDIDTICKLTEGYSGSDMKNLVKDASMGPLREALKQGIEITKLKKEDMRPVTLKDFEQALQEVRPSVSLNELGTYEKWNNQFGSLSL
uniref:AAA+ ATPase domain-containing protein n=1 Tax=Cannabis sativa TaxID=3483 RepID=A0A803QL39_CANSA